MGQVRTGRVAGTKILFAARPPATAMAIWNGIREKTIEEADGVLGDEIVGRRLAHAALQGVAGK